jgi:hypothetical protein
LAAFQINETYYGGTHFVYCSKRFEPQSRLHPMPPSSTPKAIYWGLLKDLTDAHSAKIAANRLGLKRGADAMLTRGVITAAERNNIYAAVDLLTNAEFRPVLYVIPAAPVRALLKSVPPGSAANPLAAEYIIENLQTNQFDPIFLEE